MKITEYCNSSTPNYYSVLGLSSNTQAGPRDVSRAEIKAAYSQSLLKHHPDKQRGTAGTQPVDQYSVDQILEAYRTLYDPELKVLYDRKLRDSASTINSRVIRDKSAIFETCDLDDFDYLEEESVWERDCRCGKHPAYRVTDEQLATHAEAGEALLQCYGCSLFVRVTFQAV